MIPLEFSRRLATLLLRLAIWIAPHDTRDWGHGMLSELHHVEGNWASLVWALGGAGVLAKHAMLAVILPGSHRRTVSSASELFAKERPMRKTTLVAIAACTVASLLFFLAPVFRQAFRVSLAQWHDVLHVRSSFSEQQSEAALEALVRKAQQNRDPEALAFAAVRLSDQTDNTRLAEEAVRLDPNLTWVYAIVAVQCPWRPETDSWIPELEKWDSQNALPYLITAEKIDIDQVVREKIPDRADEELPAWQGAMAAAFRSSKLDSYSSRLKELDRRVLLRYRIDDPFEALEDSWHGLPSYGAQDAARYAKLLIESGGSLEARGDRKGAAEKYRAVARFGQMLGPDGGFFVSRERKEAYQRLGTLSEMDGNKAEATFYASLTDQLDREAEKERASWRGRFGGSSVSHWNAFLVRLAGLSMFVSGGILLICAVGVVVRARSVRLPALRPSRLTLALAFASAVGALLSSAVLFVSYWPYSELLQRFLRNGDDVGLSELSGFLGDARLPLGSQFNLGPGSWYVGVWNDVFSFWFAVTIFCVVALLIAVFRHLQTRPRPRAA